ADALIRSDLQAKTDRRKAYLDKMAEETNNPDHKRALTKLLLDQEQVSMVLAAQEPFAATVVEPASVGPKPDWPRKTLLIPALIFVGIFLGYAAHALKRR
ncbi:MAG TPA: chain length determinant family protein, partial [Patescibacteria group bacterium]|nr:chain length determinant family protein [Patescibacteria group bacterium]